MPVVSDITLTNILASTVGPYAFMDGEAVIDAMSRAPLLAYLKTKGRVIPANTVKTGMNLFHQDVTGPTESGPMSVSAAIEDIKMPDSLEYNMIALSKRILLTKEQLALIEKIYEIGAASAKSKERNGMLFRALQMLKDKVMPLHYRMMYYGVEERLFGNVTGSSFKGLRSFLSPTAGPQTIGGKDLGELDPTVNEPLWVDESGSAGTGSVLGFTLTGSGAGTYAMMLRWHAALVLLQQKRTMPFAVTVVSPTVRMRLAALAENRITFTHDAKSVLPMYTLGKVAAKSVPFFSGVTDLELNGLPVIDSPSCSDNHVWLLNPDALAIEVFQDEYANSIYKGANAQKDFLIYTEVRRNATTIHSWDDTAQVLLRTICQMTVSDTGCIAAINFNAASAS